MSLKKATISNLKWSFVETISLRLINFVLTIVLARLLVPADFGVLAIINVFYLITVSFIDGGLKDALVQKEEATEEDYSSVFWANIAIAIVLYLVLFISAPFIQDFYNFENLTFFIRMQSISLIIDSLAIVQVVRSTKELNLKKITQARVPSTLLSFFVGIGMAYYGYGVLALIWQQIINSALYVLILGYKISYKPKLVLSFDSLKSLYSFGIKVFAAGYLNRIYVQSMSLIYAKFFSLTLLGLYNRANSLQQLPSSLIINSVVTGVYPTMIKIQKEDKKLKDFYKKNIQVTFILVCGISVLLFFQAENIVLVLLGKVWAGMIPFAKVLAVGGLFVPMSALNRNLLKVRGEAGLYLKLEMARKVLSLITVFLFLQTSFMQVIISVTFVSAVMTIVDMYYAGKTIKYYLWEQIEDIIPFFLIIVFIGFAVKYSLELTQLQSLVELILFSSIYIILTGLMIFLLRRKFVSDLTLLFK
jgi:teichuronic acid exporter